MIKVAMLVGSLRRESLSLKLGEYLKDAHQDKFEIEIVDINLPFYNGDLDTPDTRPESVSQFYNTLEKADAVFFITPEYNNSTSGVLKNAIDWGSRSPHLANKPGLIASQSMGMTGGARGYLSLYSILNRLAMRILPGNDILLAASHTKFDDNGALNDPGTVAFINSVMDNFVEYYQKIK